MAMYAPGFPVGYQPFNPYQSYYNQQIQQPVQQNQQTTPMMTPPTIRAEIVQVDDEQAAINYPTAVGTPQMMITKDDRAIYVKTAYANGQYQLDVFEKRPPKPETPPLDMGAYITRDEFERRLSDLTKNSHKSANKTTKEGAED